MRGCADGPAARCCAGWSAEHASGTPRPSPLGRRPANRGTSLSNRCTAPRPNTPDGRRLPPGQHPPTPAAEIHGRESAWATEGPEKTMQARQQRPLQTQGIVGANLCVHRRRHNPERHASGQQGECLLVIQPVCFADCRHDTPHDHLLHAARRSGKIQKLQFDAIDRDHVRNVYMLSRSVACTPANPTTRRGLTSFGR